MFMSGWSKRLRHLASEQGRGGGSKRGQNGGKQGRHLAVVGVNQGWIDGGGLASGMSRGVGKMVPLSCIRAMRGGWKGSERLHLCVLDIHFSQGTT
jgi:hypothetical protein